MSFELKTDYKLKPEVDVTHDLSKGLRRHMPVEYDRLGRYRKRELQLPFWPCVALVVGAWAVARVVL